MIDKGLILYPQQLEYHASSPREDNEAKGFDYVGKVRIIENVLSRVDLLLEIVTRSSGGQAIKYLVKPVELNKTGSDLTLFSKEIPDQNDLKLKVRTMSLVRSVRGSLFVKTPDSPGNPPDTPGR